MNSMKTVITIRNFAVCCLSLICSLAFADTVMIDFGGGTGGAGTNTYSSGWNRLKLRHSYAPIIGTDLGVTAGTQTFASLRNTSNTVTSRSVSVDPPGIILGIDPGVLAQTNVTVNTDLLNATAPLWETLYGVPLTSDAMSTSWSTGSLAGVLSSQKVTVGGLTAGTYTMSGVFTAAGLAGLLSTDSLPVVLSGSGVKASTAYMTSLDGSIIDLSVAGLDILNVLSGGMFMMSWEFELSSTSDVVLTFNSALLSLATSTGVSALAFGDGYRITPLLPDDPGPTIPEPTTTSFGLAALGLLALRRRK